MANGVDTSSRVPLWLKVSLWIAAVVLMFLAADYQTRTGPTYELKGDFEVAGIDYSYELIRSGNSFEDTRVAIPNPGGDGVGAIHYKRYGTDDEYSAIPLQSDGEELVGFLPRQPAAGKLEIRTRQQQAACELAELGLQTLRWDCGGLRKELRAYRLPDSPPRSSIEFTFTIPVDRTRQADQPIYVRVAQEDGHLAWSSPIYVVAD